MHKREVGKQTSPNLEFSRKRILLPGRTRTGHVNVLDGGDEVLPDPRVVHVTDSMLLANLSDRRGNVGVPGRRHAREQMVLHLEVQSARKASRDESNSILTIQQLSDWSTIQAELLARKNLNEVGS